jgi:hypothetical protein
MSNLEVVKNIVPSKCVISTELNGKVYEVHCDPQSSIGELHDAIIALKSYAVNMILSQQQVDEETNMKYKKSLKKPEEDQTAEAEKEVQEELEPAAVE